MRLRQRVVRERSNVALRLCAICMSALALTIAAGCGDDDDDGGGGGGGGSAEDGQQQQQQSVDLLLPFQDSIVWSGYEIARAPDSIYENEYGITATTTATEGSGQIQQLVAGKRDFAVTTVPETIIANAKGNKLIMVGSLLTGVFTIAATEESGVNSLEDLDGKALGVTDIGGGEIPLVNAALDDAGLSPDEDVELKVVGPGGATAFKALKSGEVAAFAGAVNDLVPLEGQGLRFHTIVPDKFTGTPDNVMTVRPDVLQDEKTFQTVKDMLKGWYEGVVFGEAHPEEGLGLICELVPEDCQDRAFAEGFYEKAIEISIDNARSGGCPNYEGLETVRDAIAAVDAPSAVDLNLEDIFPDTFCKELVPDQSVVDGLAERLGSGTG
jgi:ABC-type nitrate/sulfonate/bicarbonate transport system substrate-binding protein